MANWLTDLFEQSVPNQVRQHRERYNQYVVDAQTGGKEQLPFESWLVTQGVDPQQLGLAPRAVR